MSKGKPNNIVFIGAAVFAVGAALTFAGLRSGDKADAKQNVPAAAATAPAAGEVRSVNVGTAGVQGVTTFTVPKGKQAVAIELPSVAGLAGYARPGDFVNIYGTVKTGQPNTRIKQPLVKLALTKVQVLDVRAPQPGTAGTATYLLALDTNEAEQVIFYAKFESLWIALTSSDQRPVNTAGRGYQNLL